MTRLRIRHRIASCLLAASATAMVCGPFGPAVINCLGAPATVTLDRHTGPTAPGVLEPGQVMREHHPPDPPSPVVLKLPSGAVHVVAAEVLSRAREAGGSIAVSPDGLLLLEPASRSCP